MSQPRSRLNAFTLIELLVVVVIIGILAALVMSAFSKVPIKAKVSLAQAELAKVESSIKDYQSNLGFFPPDNPNNPAISPLYYELLGTTNNGTTYVTLDDSARISTGNINATFGRNSFSNTGTRKHATDERGAPMSFIDQLHAGQIGELGAGPPPVRILICSIEWPAGNSPPPIPGTTLNPWNYVSTHPTNNPGSYDLWVDLPLGGRTYRVNNWGKQP